MSELTPAWITAGLGVGAVILQAGVHWSTVRNLAQRQQDETEASARFREEMLAKADELEKHMVALMVAGPTQDVKIATLEKEQDFQRGRLHEISNFVQKADGINEQRYRECSSRIADLERRVNEMHRSQTG